jgi:hypothetical protein
MYKLEFTLKQHTPIIHFQHDQDGATLRATEVKPKLDRFIIEKLTNKKGQVALNDFKHRTTKKIKQNNRIIDNPDFNQEWLDMLVGRSNEHLALDYKLKIFYPNFNPQLIETKRNVKIITESSENTIFYKGHIKLVFSFLNQELKVLFNTYLNEFFVVTNFGKRQNKGFGCFYLNELTFDRNIRPVLNNYNWYLLNETNHNLLGFDNNRFRNNYQFYLIISDKWRKLKSGFNHGGNYIKSSVFKYLCNQGLRWDKRWIKKELKPLILPNNLKSSRTPNGFNEPNDCGGNNYNCANRPNYQGWGDNRDFNGEYRFGRAMLGLAEHYEFKNSNGQVTYQVQIKSNEIERYKAPVTFKVFDGKIFAIVENQNLYDRSFYFTVKIKQENQDDIFIEINDTNGNKKILCTPANNSEWDLTAFLDSFFPCINFIRQ